MSVDVTNLRADAIVLFARHHVHVNAIRHFFHEGWEGSGAWAVAEGIYAELRAGLRKPDPDDAYLFMARLWRLVHGPRDVPCLRCIRRATEPPGMGHVTVSDINTVCRDDLCALCLNQPVEGDPEYVEDDEPTQPRMPVRHVLRGEAS